MRAAIYTRVSTEEQAKEGLSLEVQERDCREFAKKQGYSVIGVYSDPGVSGADEHRPALDRLFADAKASKFDVLLTWKFDRLYRVAEFQKKTRRVLAESGIVWKSVQEGFDISTPVGNLQHTIMGGFAEWERDVIRQRTRAGKAQKARNERQPTLISRPFGYKIISKADALTDPALAGRDGEYILIPEEADAVRAIFRLYLEGCSLWQVCRELDVAGVKTKNGGKWRPTTVRGILSNPVCVGTAYHGRYARTRTTDAETGSSRYGLIERDRSEWILIPCPALITKEDFERASEMLRTNQARKSGRPDRIYPLSGLIRCAECGKTYHGIAMNRGKNRYYRPSRRPYPGGEKVCAVTTYLDADATERDAIALISRIANDPNLIRTALESYWNDEERKNTFAEERSRLQKQLAKAERQLRAIIEKELDDPDLTSVYADLKAERKAERQAIIESIAALPAEVEKPEPPTLEQLQGVCEELSRRVSEIRDLATMREAFLAIIERIDVSPNGVMNVLFHGDKLFTLYRSCGRRYR